MSTEVDILLEKNKELEEENEQLKIKLKKYTNGPAKQRYYEKNKEMVKAKSAEYMKSLDPEIKKQKYREEYLRRKQKKEKLKDIELDIKQV